MTSHPSLAQRLRILASAQFMEEHRAIALEAAAAIEAEREVFKMILATWKPHGNSELTMMKRARALLERDDE